MPQAYKVDKVAEIQKRLSGAKSIILVDYKGINIQQVNELRNRFRGEGVDYFVAKNTFIKIALNNLGQTGLDSHLEGPTAVAVGINDEIAPARVLAKFKKEVMDDKPFPSFKAGLVEDSVFLPEQLKSLAELPSREQLIAKLLSCLNAPMSGLVGALSGIMRQFVGVVDAIAKKESEN